MESRTSELGEPSHEIMLAFLMHSPRRNPAPMPTSELRPVSVFRGQFGAHCESGFALVLVLAFLVLITGLVLAFFTSVTTDSIASKSFANQITVNQLVDSSVQTVMGQIRTATSHTGNTAWASQPGMIRTYGTGSEASSAPLVYYKLYSSNDMDLTADEISGFDPVNDLKALPGSTPTDWASQPAMFTDLNAPVGSAFPILDPAAATGPDPVESFTINGTNSPQVSGAETAPMPVRWIYVLKDGTLTAPSGVRGSANDSIADWSTVESHKQPNKENPIVGRIAFWTDDETCKVNINTASDGTFWDVPRAHSKQERDFAKYQPANREFQRYPGHPAMTSIKAVFPGLDDNKIYSITPRVAGGGSERGTVVSKLALPLDSDRLYASVDELVFKPSRASSDGLTQTQVDHSRFFLTASSRAPEVTLFDTPRVAIWPIDSNPTLNYRTTFDSLLAFCATINAKPYYFQRSDPNSAMADAAIPRNLRLYAYLQKLTESVLPGFGGRLSAKYGSDRDQILTEIFDYIRSANLDDSSLAEANRFAKRGEIPGSAGHGWGQVTPIRIGSTQGFGRFPIISEAGLHFICTADGGDGTPGGVFGSNVETNKTLIAPSGGNATLLTANQRRIEVLFILETFVPGQGWPQVAPAYSVRIRGLENLSILNSIPAELGFPSDEHCFSGLHGGWTYNGRSWGGTSSQRVLLRDKCLPARGGMNQDGGFSSLNKYPFVSQPVTVTVDPTTKTMKFLGGNISIDVYARTTANGTGYESSVAPVNTYSIHFPGGTFPIPSLVPTGNPAGANPTTSPATTKENWWTFSRDGIGGSNDKGRLFFVNVNPERKNAGAPFREEDVVRTVVPTNADFRLLSATANITDSFFTKHPLHDSAANLAHSINEAGWTGYGFGATFASSVNQTLAGVPYSPDNTPDVAINPADAATTGDWDNGLAITSDGPYINMPDEGNAYKVATQVPYFDSSEQYQVQTQRSPNRQLPSPGIFGSLPTGVKAKIPYRTLLFRPQTGHFGATNPPDHLWTDFFWMPVVEPYAISEPFSTAGKINLNYQIMPFEYIRRATGLAAALRSEKVMAIPNDEGLKYKTIGLTTNKDYRLGIDIGETLKQADARFAGKDIFRSASQIMDIHLIPIGTTIAQSGTHTDADSVMASFWAANKLSGDNSRERPYANLLARLTTKSNTYTVHYRVQSLKKSPATNAEVWDEGKDRVTAEFRGSTMIERYIDPSDMRIPDFGSAASPVNETECKPLGQFYKWRVVSARKFAP